MSISTNWRRMRFNPQWGFPCQLSEKNLILRFYKEVIGAQPAAALRDAKNKIIIRPNSQNCNFATVVALAAWSVSSRELKEAIIGRWFPKKISKPNYRKRKTARVRLFPRENLRDARVGSVHTRWGSSSREPAQNGAVFRQMVPNLKNMLTFNKPSTRSLLRNCRLSAREPPQNVCTRGSSDQFSVLRKKCVHIGAQFRIIPEHCVLAPSVNTGLDVAHVCELGWHLVGEGGEKELRACVDKLFIDK